MDEWQRDEFEKRKQLEAERDKLTDAQRQQHDSFCAFHHEQKTLTPELAIKAARIIRTERGVHQMRGLDDLDSQANAAAEDKQRKAFAADDARKELRAQEAAERKAEEARAAEQRQAQEQAKQLAATETAQREPLPKSVTQFDAHLDRTAKTERDATTRATDAAKAINRGAYQSRREDFTRYDGLTALHAANTPARIPAASHAFGALDLQSRQPPQPQLERAKSNSPFAPLPFAEKQYVAIRNAPDNSRAAQQPQKAESAPNDTMRAFAPLTVNGGDKLCQIAA